MAKPRTCSAHEGKYVSAFCNDMDAHFWFIPLLSAGTMRLAYSCCAFLFWKIRVMLFSLL